MKRYGLLIGFNGEKVPRRLRYAERDVERINLWLTKSSAWRESPIYVCIPGSNYPPYEQTINAILQNLKREVQPQDLVFIYLAGHTLIDRNVPYLLIPDRQTRKTTDDRISLQTIFKASMPLAGSVMLIMDCCSAASAARGGKNSSNLMNLFMGFENDIVIDPSHKQVFIAAAAENAEAFEGVTATGDQGGYFTTYFMDGCDGGGPRFRTVDNYGVVNTSLVNEYIEQELRGKQNSYIWKNGDIAIRTSHFWRWQRDALHAALPETLLFPLEAGQPLNREGAVRNNNVSIELTNGRSWPENSRSTTLQSCSNENGLMAVGYSDGGIDVVDLMQHESMNIPSVTSDFRGLAFLSDRKCLAVKTVLDEKLRIFDIDTNRPAVTLDTEAQLILVVPGTNTLVISTKEGAITLWTVSFGPGPSSISGTVIARSAKLSEEVAFLKASVSGKFFVTGGAGTTILLWNVEEFKTQKDYRGHALPIPEDLTLNTINALAISQDEHYIAASFGSGQTLIWSTKDASLMPYKLHQAHQGHVNDMGFSADGKWIVSIGGDGYVNVTHLEKALSNAVRIIDSSSTQMLTLAFFPVVPDSMDIPIFAVGTSDGRVLIYDATMREALQEIPRGVERSAIFHLSVIHLNESTNYLLIGALKRAEVWTLVFKRRPD